MQAVPLWVGVLLLSSFLSAQDVTLLPPDELTHRDDALFAAVWAGRLEEVKAMLNRGADVNAQLTDGTTPLSMAIHYEDLPVLSVLLDEGADTEIEDHDGKTVLHAAVEKAHSVAVVSRLLRHGADADAVSNDGWTPLMRAANRGRPRVVDLLLAEDADPNAQRHDGWTALMMAVASGDAKTVGTLLAGGANESLQAHDGLTAERLAAGEGPRAPHYRLNADYRRPLLCNEKPLMVPEADWNGICLELRIRGGVFWPIAVTLAASDALATRDATHLTATGEPT